MRRQRILTFVDVEKQSCSGAMGWSGTTDDHTGVVVKELPIEMREILEGSRPARAASPPLSFTFEGLKDSSWEGFHHSAYGDLKVYMNDYLN